MLAYIEENKERIEYVIVHKIDRLARNRGDDVEITRALHEAGVKLVSTTESIDETPSGILLHGIMSSIAEFYSRNLATEVKKGMSQKVKSGGTVGRAIARKIAQEVGHHIEQQRWRVALCIE
jgi:DNA invertase Pin-like site-specific DNA recombinase